jgi:chromate transport protein ChrA
MNLISEFLGALKARVNATVQSLIWGIVAAVAAVAALAFFVAALHTWLAQHYGSIQASLALGGALLLIAVIILLVLAIMKRRAAAQMKLQRDRLMVQPASLLTTLMAQSIGPKQTSLLMLAALVAGWLMARPRQRGKE